MLLEHRFAFCLLIMLFSLGVSGCPQQSAAPASGQRQAQTAPAPAEPRAVPAFYSASLPSTPPAAPAWQTLAGKTVILDAGHGGHDTGAAYFGMAEKDINLDLARRTAASLQAKGVTVLMTRNEDAFIPLPQRSAFANRYPNAILVSIHVNAAPSNPNATGVETFVLTPDCSDADRSVQASQKYRATGYDPVQSGQALANLALRCRTRGPALASAIQHSLTGRMGEPSRGVKPGNLAVLRETYFCPAVLVEVGFLTNPRTAMAMRTDEWRRRTSEALGDGIADFLRQPE